MASGLITVRRESILVVAGVLALLPSCAKPIPFSQIQQQTITRSCVFSSCHGDGSPAASLSLKSAAYEHLVNVKSTELPSKQLVVPGDPDSSYLIEKLTSAKPAVGMRMPPNGDPLPDEELAMFREWILTGAQNN